MANYVGLDLGGTNVKCGVVNDHGQILSRVSAATVASGGPAAVIQTMIDLVDQSLTTAKLSKRDVAAVGVGSPGMLDIPRGIVLAAANLDGWNDIDVCPRIARATGLQVFLENDANAAAMGECWLGAGRASHATDLVMLTLGTGVGSGLIVRGKVVHGGFSMAGEAGHMILVPGGLPCPCGQRGCLEQYTSATAVAQRAITQLKTNKSSSLHAVLEAKKEITAKDVFDAASKDDAMSLEIVEQMVAHLAVACVTLCRLFDPQIIIIGGGMIAAGDFLLHRIRHAFEREYWTVTKPHVSIEFAELGNDAGFIGAAAVARSRIQNHG